MHLSPGKPFVGLAIAWLAITALCLWRPRLAREDGTIEHVSATGFLLAALIFAAAAILARSTLPGRRLTFLTGLSAFCLLLFLSEVSFGARAIGTPVPEMYGGGEFDGGHDLVIMTYRLLRDAGLPAAAIAIIVALALAGATWLGARRYPDALSHTAGLVRREPLAGKLAAATTLLAAAVLLDLGSGRRMAALEETTELLASALLLWAAFTELQARRSRNAWYALRSRNRVPDGRRSDLFD